MRRPGAWAVAAAFILLLPLSLAGSDVIFYQCVGDDGAVLFTDRMPGRDQRCIRLGAREERALLDNKVKRCFAGGEGSLPALRGNVIENGDTGLRRFHEKLRARAGERKKPLTIYFVGDSHLQSGDLVKGFLDEFGLNQQLDRTLLCVHQVKRVRVRKNGVRRFVERLPKDYPKGVPRICSPLLESFPLARPLPDSDTQFDIASLTVAAPSEDAPRRRGLINVYAYGISGKTFEYFAGSELLKEDLVSLRPDLVVVMLGTNDAFAGPEEEKVKRDITAFAGSIRYASPESDVLFISPPDSFFKNGRENEYIRLVRNELRQISAQQGFAFWDLYALMGGPRSMAKWQEKGLSQKDKIHFLADGYMILGRLFYQALVQ